MNQSVQRRLAAIVLGFEIIVVFLAALVIWGLTAAGTERTTLPAWTALVVGGAVIVGLMIAIAGLRFGVWALILGSVIQLVILASGILNPAMYFVGTIFGALWCYCMVMGARIDRARTVEEITRKEHHDPH